MTAHTASGVDIFVVDDECVIAHTLAIILSQVGYCVRVFTDPITARLHLHDSPKLLISDYHMPGLTGLDLAAIIADEIPWTKILLFSANLLPTDPAWQGVERNSRDARLLAKPLSPTHLLAQVEAMIGPPSVEDVYGKSGQLQASMTPDCKRHLLGLEASTSSHFGSSTET